MSLRARLLSALGILGLAFVAMTVVIVQFQYSFLMGQVDEELDRTRSSAAAQVPLPALIGTGPESPLSNLFIGELSDDGEMTTVLHGELLDDAPSLALSPETIDRLELGRPFTVEGVEGPGRFRVIGVARSSGEGWSVISSSLDDVDAAVLRLKITLAVAAAVLLVTLVVIVVWVQRLGLRPVSRVTAAAEAISGGDRSHRVTVADPGTEAGRLAEAFNAMLDGRDESEDRLRRFVADASHELRTPLTAILAHLDLHAQGDVQSDEELDEMLRRVTQESIRMHDLVEDLLLLAALDQHRPLRHEDVDVSQMVADAAFDARAMDPTRTITADTGECVSVTGDSRHLQQVVGALVSNAVSHTGNEANIRLEARSGRGGAVIVVADDGDGLSAHDAERVFDRFYRCSASRTRTSGGAGLGLSIAKSIVVAHEGTITLDTAPGEGCRFQVTLPHGQALSEHSAHAVDA